VCEIHFTQPWPEHDGEVKCFVVHHGMVEISHSPYSPDLLPIFFVFPMVKTALNEEDSGHFRASRRK
jgi:hypothetical protein